jgi:hypothetical protein
MVTRMSRIAGPVLFGSLLVAPGLHAQNGAQNTASSSSAIALRPNTPMPRTIAGGGADNYTVSLTKGQVLDATAMQQGIDVVVSVYGPDGKQLDRVDSPNGANGPEHVWLVAPVTGTYRIEVAPLEAIAASGKYTMSMQPPTMASATVQQVLASDRALGDALDNQDVNALRGLLAPDVTFIGQGGLRYDAQGLLAARQSARKVHNEASQVQVRTFGNDVAIVSGHVTSADSVRGTAFDGEWTRTWVKQNGQWKLASMQVSGARGPTRSMSVAPGSLTTYAGRYTTVAEPNSTTPATSVTITPQGDALVYAEGDSVRIPFYAEAPGVFYSNDMRGRLIMTSGANGQQILLVPYMSGGRVEILKKEP